MNYKIVYDFLPRDEYLNLRNFLFSPTFPWYFHPEVVSYGDVTDANSHAFMHTFYDKHRINSQFFECIETFLDKLDIKSLVRSKVNLYTSTSELVEHKMHKDATFSMKGAIYYLNSNDGYTKLSNGNKIESVENSILLFDPSTEHCSTNCTDEKARCTLIFNYF